MSSGESGAMKKDLIRWKSDLAEWGRRAPLVEGDVTTDHGESGVPAIHRNREVEGVDHTNWAHRVPHLKEGVVRALRRQDGTREVAGETEGIVANIDKFLDLKERG